jgi:hypothetical protein
VNARLTHARARALLAGVAVADRAGGEQPLPAARGGPGRASGRRHALDALLPQTR